MQKKYNGDNLPDLDLNYKGHTSNLLAVVRVRPLLEKDLISNALECVTVINDTTLVISEPYDSDGHTASEKTRKLQFEFPRVFAKTSSNQEIYNFTTKNLLGGLFEGLNATVFCYGAAHSGKSMTIFGNQELQGIAGYALADLQAMVEGPTQAGAVMKISYVEIYNEVIRDLLVADDKTIDIREDPVKGTTLINVSEITTSSKKDILKAIKVGNKNKTEEGRRDVSVGKAHTILMIQIESIQKTNSGTASIALSKLFLADLAGTEKMLAAKGKKLKEGGTVNRSLLALSNCITVLSEGKLNSYIPYRDSKLTRLLKDSLGGNSRTVMITNISPSTRDYEESVNSLKYAIRAKAIKNHAIKNVSADSVSNSNEMKHIIDSLQRENQSLKRQLEDGSSKTNLNSTKAYLPSKDSSKGLSSESGPLAVLQNKIKNHFAREKEIRQNKVQNEEMTINLAEDMNQSPHTLTDSNLVRLNQLKNERAKLADELMLLTKDRARLMEEVNESGMNNLQVAFLSNIIYKEQLEAEFIDSKPAQLKADKAIILNDWNVEFLKNQVIMRDKIMNNQLDVLSGQNLSPPVSYDGLRKVDNLPKDIHKTGEDLYLPPIFADRRGNISNRQGVQITTEPSQPLPSLGNQKGYLPPYRASLESLHGENYKTRNLNKLSHFDQIRNKYYRKPDPETSVASASLNRQSLNYNRYASSPKRAADGGRAGYPSSAYVANRPPGMTRYYSGSLSKAPLAKLHKAPLANSPYVAGTLVRPESQSVQKSPPRYTPMTKDDFTMEALQQKKLALERLNDKLKNL